MFVYESDRDEGRGPDETSASGMNIILSPAIYKCRMLAGNSQIWYKTRHSVSFHKNNVSLFLCVNRFCISWMEERN